VDYEFKIRMLEREIAHLKEMQQLQSGRLDIHDRGFDAVHETLAETGRMLRQSALELEEMRGIVRESQVMLKQLLDAMLTGRRNGTEQK
jgi:hypothetical protein